MEFINYLKEMLTLATQGHPQGVWFLGGLYTLLLCAYSLVFQIRTRFWPYTYGSLVEYEFSKFGGITARVKTEQEYTSDALYRYHVNGVDYEGIRIAPWVFVVSHNARFVLEKQKSSIQLRPDGKVKVFYNPANPKKSFLVVAGTTGIAITFVLCVLPLGLFYLTYHM